ncbi:hypothetical protein CHUAL_014257 [Chamberlinius hualienensis]
MATAGVVAGQHQFPIEHVLIAQRERLCTQLDNMRKNNVMCDITVVCDTTEFTAHKVVLSASSTFFHNRFTEAIDRLQVPDIGPDVMEIILTFVYTGHVLVGETNVQLVLAAAHRLRVTNLYHWCRERLVSSLTLSTLEHVWDVADLYSDPFLQSEVAQFAAKNMQKMVREGTWVALPAERLISLIGNELLVVNHHDEVLAAVLQWVKHDNEKRHRVLPDIITHIKFDDLSAAYVNSLDGDSTVMASLELLQSLTKTMARRFQRGSALERSLRRSSLHSAQLSEIRQLNVQPNGNYNNNKVMSKLERVHSNNGIPIRGGKFKPVHSMTHQYNGVKSSVAVSLQFHELNGTHKKINHIEDEPILVVLGQDKEENVIFHHYFMYSKQWSTPYRAPVQKKYANIVAHRGLIYLIGGKVQLKPSATVHAWDLKTRKTFLVKDMNVARCGIGVAELDGLIYVVGGYNKSGWLRDVESYNPISDTWEMLSPLHEGKEGVGAVVVHNKLYAIGGVPVPTTEMYDPITDQWTKLSRMRYARVYHGISALEGLLYVVGGFGQYPDRVQCFDCDNDVWNVMSTRAPQQCRDTWCAAVPWNDHIMVINNEGLLWDFDANHESWTKLPSSFCLVGGYISGFIAATILDTRRR